MRVPDTIYVGMQKTGSTYLRSYFSQHPEIDWSRNAGSFQLSSFDVSKYKMNFKDASEARCLIDMYEGLSVGYHLGNLEAWVPGVALVPGAQLCDSKMAPAGAKVIARIKETLPDARILLTLRNQVDWLRSNYYHSMLSLPVKQRGFESFLSTREGKLLLHAGNYDRVILEYQELFGPEKVCVILLEDIKNSETEVLQRLCVFLGVNYFPFRRELVNRNMGIGSGRGLAVRAYSALGISDNVARRLRPWLKPLEMLLARRPVMSAITSSDERKIKAFYAASNFNAARILDRQDLPALGYEF